ncbi:HAD hydrolase-like protein [Algoriphagus aestuariicola]|uniref:HAD hydrolase-like protein n=1 Tax=Algoriphagus aestuariicola TaxID=1852016 RepID=A0ABS3BVP9_9BACT|nr:HAD hydrolase-like protein [Algoriphagus aestuariicola]MBN7803367.1 HAD hydrolase-like protein [Algoriphagus aestuariicola]
MPKIRLAVFDMAGTTIHDENNVAKAFQNALNSHGYPGVTLQEANEKMGYSKPQAIRDLLYIHEPDKSKITAATISAIHDAFVAGMLEYYTTDPTIRAIADAEAVFAGLHEMGIKVALDTGFSRDITDIILKRVGWDDYRLVDATAASDEVSQGRPFPFMIEKIMAELGIDDPKAVIKIGDTEVDIHEGHNAGCLMSIGITSGVFSANELIPHNPSHLAHSLTEVLDLVRTYESQTEA